MPYRTAPLPEPPRRRHRFRAGLRRLSRRLRLRLARGPRWVRCYYCGRWRRPWNARAIGYHPHPGPFGSQRMPRELERVYACRSEQWHTRALGCVSLQEAAEAMRDFGVAMQESNEKLAAVLASWR